MKSRPFGKHPFQCSEIGFGAWAIGGSWGAQADANCGVSDLPDLPADLLVRLRRHNWRRGDWYGGK